MPRARAKGTALSAIEKKLAERVQRGKATLPPLPDSNVIKLDRQGFVMGESQVMDFHAIVLGHVYENTFYDRPYDPEAGQVDPLCWAIGWDPQEMGPPEDLAHPQSKFCKDCTQNEFGSRGKGKACRNGLRVALVAVPDIDDLSTVNTSVTEMGILRVAPTSIRAFNTFLHGVFRARGDAPLQYVTHFAIDTTSPYGKITVPEPVMKIDEAELLERLIEIPYEEPLTNVPYGLEQEPYEAKPRSKRRSRLS